MKIFSLLLVMAISTSCLGQSSYKDSMKVYLDDYINKHEVVPDSLKSNLHFYPVDPAYRIIADVKEVHDSPWFSVETSGTMKKTFRVFAIATFRLNGHQTRLSLLQSQGLGAQYKDYLFLPFTDATNGGETYENGRYIDLTISDIQNGHVTIDFNKAYNPYCAYVSGKYNCPVPPASNRLDVPVNAGEMKYGLH